MTTISATVDQHLKEDAVNVLHEIGITQSEAIRLYLEEIRKRGALPFPVNIPNKETAKAIRESRRGIGHRKMTLDELDALWG